MFRLIQPLRVHVEKHRPSLAGSPRRSRSVRAAQPSGRPAGRPSSHHAAATAALAEHRAGLRGGGGTRVAARRGWILGGCVCVEGVRARGTCPRGGAPRRSAPRSTTPPHPHPQTCPPAAPRHAHTHTHTHTSAAPRRGSGAAAAGAASRECARVRPRLSESGRAGPAPAG